VSYEAQVAGWHDFYIVVGTASATLVGLLFVGLSLHLQIVVSALEVRSLARVTLANFGAVLVVALFMVIPQGPSAAGSQLVGAGVVSLVVAAPSLVGAVRSGDWSFDMRLIQRVRVMLRFGFSALGYLAIVVAGILLLASSLSPAFGLLLVTIVVLFVFSLRYTWEFLFMVADVTQ